MQPEDRDAAYLYDMVQAARKAIAALEGKGLPEYLADEDLRLIIERRLEIIGEAARRLSENFRNEHPEVSWRRLIGLRNVMAHQYDEIDHERICIVVKTYLPTLVRTLEQMLPPVGQPENA
jgi:uncharacterized protein with HEPN domain